MNEPELRAHILESVRFNAARTLGSAAPSRYRVEQDGGLAWSVDPARPAAYYNRVLGFDRSAIPRLGELLAVHEAAAATPQFDLEPDALCPEVGEALGSRGFSPRGNLAYLQRSPERLDAAGVHVERWGCERADDFLALMGTSGVTCEPSVWAVKRRYYCTDTFRTFVAVIDGRPCAWATMLVEGGAGYLANAYTQGRARRRGAHTALLRARLADAADLGLAAVWTDVEWRSPSHRNCVGAAFRLLTVHTSWTA